LGRVPNTVESGTDEKCLHAVLHGLILHLSLYVLPALALLSSIDQRGGQGLKESPPAKRWCSHEGTCAFNLTAFDVSQGHMRL